MLNNIKKLRGFYDLMWEDGYPPDIIPYDSYWAFRWGPQSIKTVLSYRKISSLFKSGCNQESREMVSAKNEYITNKFSCVYGQTRESKFISIIDKLEKYNITTRDELRTLIHNNILRLASDDTLSIKHPKLTALFGTLLITICILYFLVASYLLIFIQNNISEVLSEFIFMNSLVLIFAYFIYRYSVKLFILSKKLNKRLKNISLI